MRFLFLGEVVLKVFVASLILLTSHSGQSEISVENSPFEVLMVSPSTTSVADVQQLSVTFNKPVVPLGDYEKLAKDFQFSVVPKVACQWRWLNSSTIACQLNTPLPPSTSYKIIVPAGIKALDGTSLKTEKSETFTTLVWEVVTSNLDWAGPDLPLIYLTFNQSMNLSSLQKSTKSSCGKVNVAAIDAAKGEEFDVDERRTYLFSAAPGIGLAKNCEVTIPGTALSATGSVPASDYEFKFITYPDFKVTSIVCSDNSIQQKSIQSSTSSIEGCSPDAGVTFGLTTPTTGKNLSGSIKTSPEFGWSAGGDGSPAYYKQYPDLEYTSIYLRSPMVGAGAHTVKLGGLKDRFNRKLVGLNSFTIKTSSFPPILQLPEGFGVLEKDGPHQLGFAGVNTKNVTLRYIHSKDPRDVKMWSSYRLCDSWDQEANSKAFIFENRLKTAVIETGATLNVPFSAPIDFDKIANDFKYGMFVGMMRSATDNTGGPFKAHKVCSSIFTVVTDLGLMAKVGFYSSGIWVHSIKSGEPVKGVKVGLYSDTATIFEGTTDSGGFLDVPGAQLWDPERSKFDYGAQKLYVIAETKNDFSVLPFETGTSGLNYYQFSLPQNPLTQSTNHIVRAITDRPLYKPGQTVNVKVFARHWEPRTFGLTPAKNMKIEVRDALDKRIFEKSLVLSEFGTADFSFDLAAGSPLGEYVVSASADSYVAQITRFSVQVFALPAFMVKVEAKKDRFEVGESADFSTAARYHFGGGVPNAKGAYVVNFRPDSLRPQKSEWDAFTFEDSIDFNIPGLERPRAAGPIVVTSGDVKTDKNGEASSGILLPDSLLKTNGLLDYGISIKDDRGKNIAGMGTAKVFYSKFSIGIKTPKWAYEAKEEINPEVVVLNHDEKSVPSTTVELKLIHRTFKTVRRRGEGSYFYYDTKTKDREIAACTFQSGPSPSGCPLKSLAAGDHYIVARAKDSRGRWTQTSLETYVTGKEYVGWYRENHDRIEVVPDKKSYNVGEVVKLLVKNPFPDVQALFTIERFGVLKQFRKKLTQGAEIVSIPLDSKDYAPGFFVAVQLIKGRVSEKIEGGVDLGKPSFKMGLTQINVIDPDTVLSVVAKSDKEQYEPGDKTDVVINVNSPGGKEVAELSVAVVDEKILQLSGNYKDRYNLHDEFYQLRGGDVQTSQMLSFLVGRRHFGKKGAPAGGDGDSATKLRKNILPLAYWNPAVLTDKSGRAEVHFSLPDNLTTWRVLVVAADKKHRFGFGSGTFIAAKKIMIEPALPSFLTEGDQLKARFSVFNRSGAKAVVKAGIETTGVKLAGPTALEQSIDNNGKAYFEWNVNTPFGITSSTFNVTAKTPQNRDGVSETIPVYPYAYYDTFATYGSTTAAKVLEPLQIPGGIRTDLGGLDVLLSPSLISHLDDALRYLFQYPYSCWEQTMVRAIALGQYFELKDYLSIPDLTREPKSWASELLAEIPKFQFENGGMAFWKPDQNTVDPYLSAFTALGLGWLGGSKIEGNQAAKGKLFSYLEHLVDGSQPFPKGYSGNARATVLAMSVHVLSLQGKDMSAMVNTLFQQRKQLSLFGKSFLWMVAAKQKKTLPLLKTLKNEIYSAVDLTSGTIQFKELNDDGFIQILNSTTRTNCSLLSAMLAENSAEKFVEPLVRWIIADRKSNRWNNTQENIFCLNALAQYAKIFEKTVPSYTVKGKTLGQEIKGADFKSFKALPTNDHVLFRPEVVGTKSELVLEKTGPGRLYYTARMRIAYKEMPTKAVNSGMQVSRTYFSKESTGGWKKQDGIVKLKRGQLVRVQLNVTIPAVRHQVVLDDRLPAGLEPVNTALGGTSKEDAKDEKNDSAGSNSWNEDDNWYGFYSSGGFYHRELRLHAVQYFADFIGKGTFKLSYIAQAIATGEFNANPALIEQMYEPEVYGKSMPAKFVIEE